MRQTLLQSTGLVSGLTLSSRILGFARDLVIAQVFGASASTDAFFVAFKIPNFLRRLFAEGAFSQAFVPVLAAAREDGGDARVKAVIDRVTGSFTLFLVLLTLAGTLLSPLLIQLFAPGFSGVPDQAHLASDLLRITFPYLILIALTALSGGILNTYGDFLTPAATPVLLNIAMIFASLTLASQFEQPVTALAVGVLMGGMLQLALQIPPPLAARTPAPPETGASPSGCATGRGSHVAGAFRRLGHAGQSSDQHAPGLSPDHGQHLLALLFRPFVRISFGAFGRRCRHGDPAASLKKPREGG